MWAPNSETGSTKDAASFPRVQTPCQDTAQLKKRPNSGAKDSRIMYFQLVLSNQFEHYNKDSFCCCFELKQPNGSHRATSKSFGPKTRTYLGRVGSGRLAGRPSGVGQDWVASELVPGHPWDEKGLRREKGVGLLVGIQERRALFIPVINRL